MPALLVCLELGGFASLRDTLPLLTRARISARAGPDEIRMCDSFRAGQRLYSVEAPAGGWVGRRRPAGRRPDDRPPGFRPARRRPANVLDARPPPPRRAPGRPADAPPAGPRPGAAGPPVRRRLPVPAGRPRPAAGRRPAPGRA